MKKFLASLISVSFILILASCSNMSSDESKGDKAYNQSKKSQGLDKRILEKRAYIYYQRAYQAQPEKNKLNLRFKQRFLDMTINRALMVLTEGTQDMDAINLFIDDIDSMLTKDIVGVPRQQYGDFLVTMADSSISRNKLDDGLMWLSKAEGIVENPKSIIEKKKLLITDFAKQYFEMASQAFVEGKDAKDAEALVKAEYYIKLVMVYDSAFPGAKELLSNLYKTNVSTVSGYAQVIEGKLDPRVNKFDIFFAIISGTTSMNISMFNNSYNPQRMKPENFSLIDADGNKYVASPSSKIDPEILDTQRETKNIRLVFPKTKAPIKKLVYENGPHYSEKNFF